jgi:alkaline phosphatase
MDFENPEAAHGESGDGFGETGSTKKRVVILLVLVGVLLLIILAVALTTRFWFADFDRPRNLVLMVADGFGPAQLTLARLASPHGKLLLDELLVGKISTASEDSLVTDSAAGATAYACGLKTFNGGVAVKPDGKACATLLEAAKASGMRTGLVVTSELTHATPAAFAAHCVDRDEAAFIGRQMLESGVDVAMGGGMNIFKNYGMWDYATTHFNVITTKEELETAALARPLLGVFAANHFPYSIDGGHAPSLEEMTVKAFPLLANKKGFFMMIEGSRIDHAAHSNDVAAMVQEVLAFDEALRAVVEYAEQTENTLVVVVADHETGGLGIGRGDYSYNVSAVHAIHASIARIASNVTAPYTQAKVIAAVQRFTELWATGDEAFFPKDTIEAPTGVTASTIAGLITTYFNVKTQTGWTTKAHTGVDVSLFAYGMGSSHFVGGIKSNDAVGRLMAEIMKFDLEKLTNTMGDITTTSTNKRTQGRRVDPLHDASRIHH